MQLRKLSRGELIVLPTSALLLVLSVIDLWGRVGAFGREVGFDAWTFGFLVRFPLLLAGVCLALTLARAMRTPLDLPPGTYIALGAVATFFLLLGLVAGPSEGGGDRFGAAIEVSRGLLLFIAPLLTAAIAYGGYLHVRSARAARSGTRPSPSSPVP